MAELDDPVTTSNECESGRHDECAEDDCPCWCHRIRVDGSITDLNVAGNRVHGGPLTSEDSS